MVSSPNGLTNQVVPLPDEEQSLPVALLLVATGGFLDAFTWVGHGQVFANAQSGNLVLLGLDIAQQHWADSAKRILPIAAFVLGVICARRMKQIRPLRRARSIGVLSLFFEIGFLLLIAFMPHDTPDVIIVMGVSFLAALQSASFTTFQGKTFNSVTMTTNIRRVAESFEGDITGIRTGESYRQQSELASVIVSFCLGAASGGILTERFGNAAAGGCAFILCVALLLSKLSTRGTES